jgi:hypothetical protein
MKRDDDRPTHKPHVERHARRLRKLQESERDRPRSFNEIMKAMADRDDASDDPIRPPAATHHASTAADLLVESGRFPHRTAALDHLLNSTRGAALLQRMHKADQTAKDSPMDTVYDIMKAGSIAGVCAAVVAKRRTSISQDDLVSAVSKVARERWPELSEAQAYAKVDADPIEGPVLRQAVNVTKASLAETMLGPGLPVQVVGGPSAMLDAVGNDQSEIEQARAELMRIGREQYPRRTENEVFEMAFSDPRNASTVARLYRRPTPTSIYPLPNEWLRGDGEQHAKADSGSNSAYDALMLKAEAYRNAHPELSISQAFEKIYTNRDNVELAKRERIESAPR